MAPEVLIVGDVVRRTELLERIRGLGYDAAIGSGTALERRIARGMIPAAVVVCIDEVEPRVLMEELRRTRRGSGVPVTLYGPLGGRIGDLADVLDLGADHFLEAPADDEQLASALEELVGPGLDRELRAPPVRASSEPHRTAPAAGASARDGSSGATDAVLGQLHRTLDMLESRLRDREHDGDDLDLAELGFDELPGGEPTSTAEVGAEVSIELPPSPRQRTPSEISVRGRHRDPTERLRRPSELSSSRSARSRRRVLPVDDRGSLDRMEVPRLVWALHGAGYTGGLSLHRGRVEKRMWWRDGQLLFAHGNTGHDRLADGLLRRGLLTRDQYGEARAIIEAEPLRAASQLVDSGLLKAREAGGVLRHHLVRIVDSTFPWTEGSWELSPDEGCEQSVLREISMPLMIAEGIRHRMEARTLAAWLGGLERVPRIRVEASERPRLVEELRVTPAEEVWLGRLDGRHSLRELVEGPGVDELEVLGLVYLLLVVERLELGRERQRVARDADPDAIDMARIRDRLHRSRAGDYFEVLDLPRDACRVDVRRAHAELSHTFSDEQLEPAVRETLGSELEELRELVDEARDVLIDEALRSAYLAHLEEP